MNQTERLLMHLKNGHRINPLTAWTELGVYRLAARVFDLEQQGIKVSRRMKKVRNRWGEDCTVKEYYLEK